MNGAMIPVNELPSIVLTEARHRRSLLVLLFAAAASVGLAAGFLWPKKYSASTTILVEESNIIKPLMEGRAVWTNNADRAALARDVVFSRKVMQQILAEGGWLDNHPDALQQDRLIEAIKDRTSLTNVRDNLIRIEYSDSDPQRAFRLTKRFGDLFVEESLAAKERESREAFEFISKQVDDYRHKLTEAEDNLKAFRRTNADARPGSEVDTNARISGLRTQIENARMDLMEQRSREGALVAQLSGQSKYAAVQGRDFHTHQRLGELQNELDKLLLTYTDQHPDVIRIRHQMQDLREQMSRGQQRTASSADDETVRYNPLHVELNSKLAEMRRNAAAAQSRMQASEQLLQQELDRSQHIADTSAEVAELQRDYEVNRDIYQDLLKRRENARVSMNLDATHRGLTFDIQEPATLPLRPLGFRFLHFSLAGFGLGLALPFALLFAFMRWDPRVRSANQLEQQTGMPVLATVPTYLSMQERARVQHRDRMLTFLLLAVIAAYGIALFLKWMWP